jgi:hypothetical protein
MLQIKEWRSTKEAQLECGHRIKLGETGYMITLLVCQQDATCLFQAIRACFEAQKKQAAEGRWKPSTLYKLWHACFGKTKKERPAD